MKTEDSILVQSYNPQWPEHFAELRNTLWTAVADFAVSIEHVGSTSVLGLWAKPIIDIDIIIPDASFLPKSIEALTTLGYDHRGNLGIVDRDAFRARQPKFIHNLYVCPRDSLSLKNHLCLRDTLRASEPLREEYSALKRELARQFPQSIDDYVEGKTSFILKILEQNGLAPDRLEQIRVMNLAPGRLDR